ncbi:MAG: WD40 repeat domain-containing serine/threonine-protein kinase, partial [Polyangiales bacterium]
MAHPTLEDIVAGSALAHVSSCDSCRQLASLAGVEVAARSADDLDRLSVVDDAVYTDWTPLPDAHGGMGQIFRVRDRRLGRFVAIKQLKPGLPEGDRAILVRRFEREARLTARLQHPAIVGVHEAGRFESGEPFYAMPLFRGAPLGTEISKRKKLEERLGLLANLTTVAEAIAYAHEQGIVHRDIKPDNILIGQFGETVVIDWGLAKDVSDAGGDPDGAYRAPPVDGLTQFGVGTANYMPPEQAKGDEPEPSFDVYALGATLYHLLAGVPPYVNADSSDIRRALIDRQAPRPLAEIDPDVPPELADIVAHAMALDRTARLPSARELASELRRYQTGQLLSSRRYTLGELVRHWMKKHRTALRISAVAAVVVLALAVFAFVRISRERDLATNSQHRAERELRRAQGIVASRSAADPVQRLDAILLGVRALAPDLLAGTTPVPEAVQGLTDALTAGPPLVPLRHDGVIKWFAATGKTLIGVDDARSLVIWDARSGARIANYPSELPQPERPRISPDGTRAVVCGFDRIGEVFELANGAHRSFQAPVDFAGCAFLPDGRIVTAADAVAVRDPMTAAVVETFALPARASSIAVASTGTIAVATIDGALWLRAPGAAPVTVKTSLPLGATSAFDRTGTTLYNTGNDQIVRAFSVADPLAAPREVFKDARSHLATVMTSPEGDRVAIGMWDLDGARHSRVIDEAHPAGIELDGTMAAWANQSKWAVVDRFGPLALADVETAGTVLPMPAHAVEATSLAYGDRLASASRDGSAFLWDIASGDATGLLLGHTGELVVTSVQGDMILTAGHDGSARVWSATDGRSLAVLTGAAELTAAVWMGHHHLVVGDLAGHVRTYEVPSGTLVEDRVFGGPISALAVSPDLARLAVGTLGGELRDADRMIAHDAGPVTALTYTADGARL